MEYISWGNLRELMIERKEIGFCENEVRKIISGILKGIEYLHNNSIIHRDIKPGYNKIFYER